LMEDVSPIYKKCVAESRVGRNNSLGWSHDHMSHLASNASGAECGGKAELQGGMPCRAKPCYNSATCPATANSLLQVGNFTNTSPASEKETKDKVGACGVCIGCLWQNACYSETQLREAFPEYNAESAKGICEWQGGVMCGIPSRPDAAQQIENFMVDWALAPSAGPVTAGQDLNINIRFRNTAAVSRTVNLLFSVTACDYRGKPIMGYATRGRPEGVPTRLQLRNGGATLVTHSFQMERGDAEFPFTVRGTEGLHPNRLGQLEIDQNSFLDFHFSVAVEGHTINYEARRLLNMPREYWQRVASGNPIPKGDSERTLAIAAFMERMQRNPEAQGYEGKELEAMQRQR